METARLVTNLGEKYGSPHQSTELVGRKAGVTQAMPGNEDARWVFSATIANESAGLFDREQRFPDPERRPARRFLHDATERSDHPRRDGLKDGAPRLRPVDPGDGRSNHSCADSSVWSDLNARTPAPDNGSVTTVAIRLRDPIPKERRE
jgi:hypothetical protein